MEEVCLFSYDTFVLFQQAFEKGGASSFWQHFDAYSEKKHHVRSYTLG